MNIIHHHDRLPEMVFYLSVKRSDGTRVERFTSASDLFDRVAEIATYFDWNVSTSYLKAATH